MQALSRRPDPGSARRGRNARSVGPSMSEFEHLMVDPALINENLEQWMAMVGKELVAVGPSVKEVLARAREKYPDSEPFIAKFPKHTAMLL